MSQIDQSILYRTHLATFANGAVIMRNPFNLESKGDVSIVDLAMVLIQTDEFPNNRFLLLSRDAWNLSTFACKSFKDKVYQHPRISSLGYLLYG